MKTKKTLIYTSLTSIIILCIIYWLFFSSLSKQKTYVYVTKSDSISSINKQLKKKVSYPHYLTIVMMEKILNYNHSIKNGRYDIANIGTLQFVRHLKNGQQSPVKLTIPIVHTKEDLCNFLGKKLSYSSNDFLAVMNDSAICATNHQSPSTILCIILPNTYHLYWNITPDMFLDRMHKEWKKWWNAERLLLAKEAGLTPEEVYILASIVEQETANNQEKNMIAGMYLNRYRKGMRLQADPTVKFANQQFAARRITGVLLKVDSPYNTYKYQGLPPGPICIPSIASINAVLHYAKHNYMYMCAKEDFSGTHNFAETYEEHKQNAKKYTDALNAIGIKK